MCTILFLHRVHPELPLIFAANRDEYYARPSAPPARLGDDVPILAGLDKRAGGTWLGVNGHGVVVGLTNQRTLMPPDPTRRSRGEVVLGALAARSVSEVAERLERAAPADYNAFNLLFGDGVALYAAYFRPEARRVEIEVAPEGVHVLPNDRIGAPFFPKADRARDLARALSLSPWESLAPQLAGVLADHALPELSAVQKPPVGSPIDHETLRRMESVCLHGEVYGTCSSSLIALRPKALAHYLFSDGPPCTTPFREVTSLLRG